VRSHACKLTWKPALAGSESGCALGMGHLTRAAVAATLITSVGSHGSTTLPACRPRRTAPSQPTGLPHGPHSGHVLARLSAFTGSAPAGIHLGSAVLAHLVRGTHSRRPERTAAPPKRRSDNCANFIRGERRANLRPVVSSYQCGGKQIAPLRSPTDPKRVGGRLQ